MCYRSNSMVPQDLSVWYGIVILILAGIVLRGVIALCAAVNANRWQRRALREHQQQYEFDDRRARFLMALKREHKRCVAEMNEHIAARQDIAKLSENENPDEAYFELIKRYGASEQEMQRERALAISHRRTERKMK